MIDRSVEQQFAEPPYPVAMMQLLSLVRHYMTPAEVDYVVKAFQLTRETCQDVPGNPTRPIAPLDHALAVTTIMAQMMHVDSIGIAAGLVYEAVDAELLLIEQVEYVLGAATARIAESMLRLNILERKKQNAATGAILAIQNTQLSSSKKAYNERDDDGTLSALESKKPRVREAMRRQQAETVRKMFVAMADDPRVVLLKLAYRLHAMRLMCQQDYHGDPQEMLTMAEESREIYAPLAGRLGMSLVESELQDLAFQILEPDRYIWVRNTLDVETKQWRSYVERVCDRLRSEMASLGVTAEISGRVKHPYSFYKKIVRIGEDDTDFERLKAVFDISQIHDLLAFRILVDTTTDCYVALGHVHSLWRPKEGRIKDFIANPKPNGYSALHTTVFCLDDQLVEIQIRTHEMHETAEYGVAMHWHYKDVGDTASASAKELLTWLRQLTEWQQDLRIANASDTEFVEAVKDDYFQEQIFVLTPKGEVKDLPVGSTPLDFAYRIHSKIGDHCSGARIISSDGDGSGDRLVSRMVPLNYELKNGEIVDIVTSRSAHPTRDWLNSARTTAARNKIRRYLKINERPINIQIGQERLERELKALGTRDASSISEDAENWVCSSLNADSFDDLLAAIGADDLRPRAVIVKLQEYWQRDHREKDKDKDAREAEGNISLPAATPSKQAVAQLEVAGVSGLLTRLANCCYPLPDDNIVGFISRGKGVIVHRSDCRNVARLGEKDRERLIHVNWAGMGPLRYNAPVVITANDRTGLIRDVATVVSDAGANLMSINSNVSTNHQTVVIMATLEIDDLDQLHRLFSKLERIKGVTHVARDLGQRK
ncbi:RelA/SpoT family protein [Dictyobacter arantiisoli]|uniref:(P)ppGpp synthetase n=1 Tax=Dictyobacter arantiisoli TaxID=2014874 RepID=A0A5A5T911_9CHLR|nr:RelA/SpoT family protein [Dictyobacter arantiisoli]GCF07479.1 (p)ppGpp synthetase [Dictyobacter arantiisoli]